MAVNTSPYTDIQGVGSVTADSLETEYDHDTARELIIEYLTTDGSVTNHLHNTSGFHRTIRGMDISNEELGVTDYEHDAAAVMQFIRIAGLTDEHAKNVPDSKVKKERFDGTKVLRKNQITPDEVDWDSDEFAGENEVMAISFEGVPYGEMNPEVVESLVPVEDIAENEYYEFRTENSLSHLSEKYVRIVELFLGMDLMAGSENINGIQMHSSGEDYPVFFEDSGRELTVGVGAVLAN